MLVFALLALLPTAAAAEDGYDLWLRYHPLETPARTTYSERATSIVEMSNSPTLKAAADELRRGLDGLLGMPTSEGLRDGAIVLGTPTSSPLISGLHLTLQPAGDEGYCIWSTSVRGHPVTAIAANRDVGVLYGAFAYLRLIQTRSPTSKLNICDSPRVPLRMLDHWDNLDGTVERGYAGPSLWNWDQLPAINQRVIDYARANASIGINGIALNNVNADARILTPQYLRKVACDRGRVSALRHPRLSLGALLGADRDRRSAHRRSTRSEGPCLVAR